MNNNTKSIGAIRCSLTTSYDNMQQHVMTCDGMRCRVTPLKSSLWWWMVVAETNFSVQFQPKLNNTDTLICEK